jgi:hypothetical protein
MVGLFFIGLGICLVGVVVSCMFASYEKEKASMISIIIGFVLTISCWIMCWVYDSPQEILARLKYDHVRTLYVAENSLADFGIDTKKSNIIHMSRMKICKIHNHTCNCNVNCQNEWMLYLIIGENDNPKTEYDMIVEHN